MTINIRCVQYFYVMIEDEPGQAYQMLSELASAKVNLLAFSVVPSGSNHIQFILYPESVEKLARFAEKRALVLCGPSKAFLISGDDKLGALVGIHQALYDADIRMVTSSGVADGRGGYGYLLHVRPENYDEVAQLLKV